MNKSVLQANEFADIAKVLFRWQRLESTDLGTPIDSSVTMTMCQDYHDYHNFELPLKVKHRWVEVEVESKNITPLYTEKEIILKHTHFKNKRLFIPKRYVARNEMLTKLNKYLLRLHYTDEKTIDLVYCVVTSYLDSLRR